MIPDAFGEAAVKTRRLGLWGSVGAGFIALLVYLLTLAPTLTWSHNGADGGELATAVLIGGVPHPPGYPTYLWLGSLAVNLGVGEPAFRLNLLSAVMAAGAAILTGWTASSLAAPNGKWLAGLIASLCFAFSPMVWSQAVIVEVYAPASFFAALILWLILARRLTLRSALVVGVITGVGMGVHLTLIGLLPVIGAAMWRGRRIGAQMLAFAAGLVAGLAPFAWLILRAQNGAPVNWGNATTLSSWWWLVSGTIYQPYVFGVSPAYLPTRLLAWASLLARQFTPIGALLAVGGWYRLWQGERLITLALAITAVGWSVFSIGYKGCGKK